MRVAELWRYPVKGLRGESLTAVDIGAEGIAGDRSLRVVDERGIVTGRRKQRMVALPATLAADGEPLVDGSRWDSADAADAIRSVAGAGAKLSRPAGGHEFDAAPILIVSDGSLAQLGYDRRRFRPNVVIEGADGPIEQDWLGRELRLGAATLRVREPCERCVITTIDPDTIAIELEVLKRVNAELGGVMGAYCDVVEPGAVAIGDAVEPV